MNPKPKQNVLESFWSRNGGDNYCGPYYTGGKIGGVDGVPAEPGLDQLCREHDAAYAQGKHVEADQKFIREAKKFRPSGPILRTHDFVQADAHPLCELCK